MGVKKNLYYNYFKSLNNVLICYGIWKTNCKVRKGIVILLGGRAEYLEKHLETVKDLTSRGLDVCGMDWRGQGLSTRVLKNRFKGFVEDYDEYVKDLRKLFDILSKHFVDVYDTDLPVILLAHSMGGHICLRFIHDYPDFVDKVVLVSPMIDIFSVAIVNLAVRKIVNVAVTSGLKKAYAIGKTDKHQGQMRFNGNRLTSDYTRFANRIRDIEQNPNLALGGVTYGWLDATFKSIDLVTSLGYVEEIRTPILFVSASDDKVVSVQAQIKVCSRISNGQFISIEGALHEILHEKDSLRDKFFEKMDRFI